LKVNSNGRERLNKSIHLETKNDVTRFVVKDDVVVSGSRNGSVFGWSRDTGDKLFDYSIDKGDAQCVDVYDGLVVSGSKNRTVQVIIISTQFYVMMYEGCSKSFANAWLP